ncbi:transcriptional regulator [bacterium F11]|nr:transcriptional regulator [bacterium F11]
MSGHSRWAGIKHKKAVVDAKRGKIFTKIVREIMVAAKNGGGKPENNPRLRKAIDDAKAANVPQDNVKRAIQKGTGELPGQSIEELTYEGYGPGGVAIFIEATTDNKNRTTSQIRHLFSEHGGNLGESGCVAFLFDSKGYITVPKESLSEEKMMSIAIEVGADDIKTEEETYEIFTDPAQMESIKDKLLAAQVKIASSEISLIPKNSIKLEGDDAKRCLELMEALEEHDDVKTSSANFDISDEILQKVTNQDK